MFLSRCGLSKRYRFWRAWGRARSVCETRERSEKKKAGKERKGNLYKGRIKIEKVKG